MIPSSRHRSVAIYLVCYFSVQMIMLKTAGSAFILKSRHATNKLKYRLYWNNNFNPLSVQNLEHSSNIDSFIDDYTLSTPPSDEYLRNISIGQRIVSFGDVHGDLNALTNFMKVGKLMDPNSTPESPIWIGGDTVCVQCGDILDRGEEELACIRLISSLSKQAKEAGGCIICLLGNHEIKNALGSFEYTLENGNKEFDLVMGPYLDYLNKEKKWRLQFANNEPSRWAICEPGLGLLSKHFFANMKVAVVVGNTAFVHAGLTKGHVERYGDISGLNLAAKEWILKVHHNENNNDANFQSVEEVINSAQNRMKSAFSSLPHCIGGDIGSESPIWMRDYSRPCDKDPMNPHQAQSMIDEVLSEIGCKRLVMGHTPQSQINAALKGKAWRIDVGASMGVKNGVPEVLEIIHGDEEDSIHILTMQNQRISDFERHVLDIMI